MALLPTPDSLGAPRENFLGVAGQRAVRLSRLRRVLHGTRERLSTDVVLDCLPASNHEVLARRGRWCLQQGSTATTFSSRKSAFTSNELRFT